MSEKLVLNKRSVCTDNSLSAYNCRCSCRYCDDCSCSTPAAAHSGWLSTSHSHIQPTISMHVDATGMR